MLHAADYTEHHMVNVVCVYRVYILHFLTFGYSISVHMEVLYSTREGSYAQEDIVLLFTDTLFKMGCYSSTPQI